MPAIPQKIREAVSYCLAHDIAFAAYRLPGDRVRFLASRCDAAVHDTADMFSITMWNRPYAESARISADYDENTVREINYGKSCDDIFYPSTDRNEYNHNLAALVDLLADRGGKTVISRIISGEADSIDWTEAAEMLFATFPKSFCHIYYHPMTGAWLGATPEILVRSDRRDNLISTMALAGTKTLPGEWDDKNRQEQQMVTDFIVERLQPLSTKMEISPVTDLEYGNIAHLCTRIRCVTAESVTHQMVCDALSPTPAVAGLPKEKALDEIKRFERHERLCYGGYITVKTPDRPEIISYVNLRCIHFRGNRFSIYAGGGITSRSIPEKEWDETEAKAKVLKEIINSFGNARTR